MSGAATTRVSRAASTSSCQQRRFSQSRALTTIFIYAIVAKDIVAKDNKRWGEIEECTEERQAETKLRTRSA